MYLSSSRLTKHWIMKKSIFFLSLSFLFSIVSIAQEALNVNLLDQYNRGDERYSGCWGYVAPDGSEYALLGAKTGTAIYSLDDNSGLAEICIIEGPVTNWREITVIGDFAYVITDEDGVGHGMQVLDLTGLPLYVELVTTYTHTFEKGHIIQRDLYSEAPFVYVMGAGLTQGVHIMDVTYPENPIEIGFYQPGYYIHDCFVKGDRMYASAFYEGTIDVVDISDKTNPILLTRIDDVNGSTHSAFLTEDNTHLVVCDESDGLPATIYNVEDLDDITKVARYTANSLSLVHNPYIKGDFVYFSHNTEGLRVVDIADPSLPIEVGYFDTFDGESGGFHGLWSACPFLPSGKILGGDRTNGLYVWTFDDVEAGRFYGEVVDSVTNAPIFNASIVVLQKADTLFSDFSGKFKSGGFPGVYSLLVTAEGYKDKLVTLALSGGDSLNVSVKLVAISTSVNTPNLAPSLVRNFPNPFVDYTMIDLSEFPDGDQLQLYHSSGKLVRSIPISGKERYRLERKNFSSGVYVYCILDQSGKTVGVGEMSMH